MKTGRRSILFIFLMTCFFWSVSVLHSLGAGPPISQELGKSSAIGLNPTPARTFSVGSLIFVALGLALIGGVVGFVAQKKSTEGSPATPYPTVADAPKAMEPAPTARPEHHT